MSGFNIADLAVLGIAQRGSIPTTSLINIAKAMVPDLWYPTTDVIEFAVQRNLKAGFLSAQNQNSANISLTLTPFGATQLRSLLLCDPGKVPSSITQATEAVQFCLLDAIDSMTAERVLCRLRGRLQERKAAFDNRCERCPHHGRYARLWMNAEQRHLETTSQMLEEISSELGDYSATERVDGHV